ncbi:MAG: sn-glycerol-3-phosphate ABC transporter ATP-binding protein UgpC [Steroidobacteraceae bacterium]|jgi:multiple sugar transport system ATP-binding protein|nr:sn-glycerol-3-phosphate ABC transporter ATP-binding protein UgpC [Steroidobacteraceae bacterium]
MACIELDRLVKRYADGSVAVDDVTLDIADGELMILVGPSGCGKSTLLRMIVGLEDITSGEVRIDGERVNDKPPHERDLAMVFQNYALYPHLNVYENIAFPLRLRKTPEHEVRTAVQRAAEMLELAEHLPRRPAQLSGGQRQRVAMGRAIVRDAKAFLFDEPLSNLDARLRAQMRAEIARMQRRLGATTVYVTHDQTEAMTLGDRVAVLRAGVLQQYATPRELYEQPANLFVAGFIGAPTMNFAPAHIEDGELRLPFARTPLPPGIDAANMHGRQVVAGIRPTSFEEAQFVDAGKQRGGATFTAEVDLVEWLGSDQYAYIPYALPHTRRAELDALAAWLDRETLQPQLIVSLDPARRVAEGATMRLWVDGSQIHLFDPKTGKPLTNGAAGKSS